MIRRPARSTAPRCLTRALLVAACCLAAQLRPAAAQPLGDANCDSFVDETDVGVAVAALFEQTRDCNGADANLDWTLSVADVAAIVRQQANDSLTAQGPRIQYFGLAGADGGVLAPIGEVNGVPVYFRTSGFGIRIVIEGNIGASTVRPGTTAFDLDRSDPSSRPDVQIESSRDLGDGSRVVCDGGIAATFPSTFAAGQVVTDTINDFACGAVAATAPSFACTQDQFGSARFVTSSPFVQFCVQVSRDLAFAAGDTVLSARLRDLLGNLGPEKHLIVRIGSGPLPTTFTPTPTRPPASPSVSRTATPTSTLTPTRTPPPTATPTITATRKRSATPTLTATVVASATPTVTVATFTPTIVGPTPTGPTPTRTRTRSPTRTLSPTVTPTQEASPSPTVTNTAAALGPAITYFGLVFANDEPMSSITVTPAGLPVFRVGSGVGFAIVIEGKRGASNADVGCLSFRESIDAGETTCPTYHGDSLLPDLLVVVSQPLGNGSVAVCDASGSGAGGVPAVDPPQFDEQHADPINDLGCRFVDGMGQPEARIATDGCVSTPPTYDYGYANDASTILFFSSKITSVVAFPPGDTVITARLRDADANLGNPAAIVVRVGN